MTLPREAYTTQKWLDRERAELFSKTWHFVGLAHELKDVGDYVTVQAGMFPLMVLVDKDETLSAFHNICRHRGATLLEGAGNTGKSIVCPYHRWTYVTDGRLKGMPHMQTCFPDLDRASLGLKPASVGLFKGLVFVNADPDADFDAFINPIADKAWPHDLTARDVVEVPTLHYKLKCDWKVFVENGIDGYHLAYLHESTLGGPEVDENIWVKCDHHMIWYATEEAGVLHSLPLKNRKEAKAMWASKIKSAEEPGYAGVYHLFPNTLIAATPYSFSINTLSPTGVGTCDLTVRHFGKKGEMGDQRKYIPGYDKTTNTIRSELWKKPALESGDFQTEDVWICEKIQMGLNSPAFEWGPLSQGPGAEDPIRWFHSSIREFWNNDNLMWSPNALGEL